MNKPHIHRDVIRAWADGAQIQSKFSNKGWLDITDNPQWYIDTIYRVKPEPKPDSILLRRIELDSGKYVNSYSYDCKAGPNVKYIFDGETNQLKSVELIKHE